MYTSTHGLIRALLQPGQSGLILRVAANARIPSNDVTVLGRCFYLVLLI